uniref:Uncharacterized protein n=1 Tax=Oryza meridionalis TaxID=40149 RepID=A0A0E0EA55_9ORYZ
MAPAHPGASIPPVAGRLPGSSPPATRQRRRPVVRVRRSAGVRRCGYAAGTCARQAARQQAEGKQQQQQASNDEYESHKVMTTEGSSLD